MNPIFYPSLNFLVRHAMKPFAHWLSPDAHPRVNGTVRVKLNERRGFSLHVNPTSFLGKRLFFEGLQGWEINAASVVMRLFRRVNVFIDAGANIGYYTLLAKACNPSLQVLSIEPGPDAFLYLEKNVRLNRCYDVTCVRKALSDVTGSDVFHLSVDPTFKKLNFHLTATAGLDEKASTLSPIMQHFEVETITLDQLVDTHLSDRRVDLVKLDTEANEHRVLRGAERVLTEHRPILLCEVLPGTIENELAAIFDEYDYRPLRIHSDGLEVVEALKGHGFDEKEHLVVPVERSADVQSWLRER